MSSIAKRKEQKRNLEAGLGKKKIKICVGVTVESSSGGNVKKETRVIKTFAIL